MDQLVEKRSVVLPSYTFLNGQTIGPVSVGYETYGTPGRPVVVVCHSYGGTSHAAGRYHPSDPLPGFWDELIGPGRPIDTDRYYVVCMDALGNINARAKNVFTTGPASINPATGRRYGASFPQGTLRDMVRVQKACLEQLGIHSVAAVVGPSMGGALALEWAVTFPEAAERIVAVAAGPATSARFNMLFLARVDDVIRLDPAWRGGEYAPDEQPIAGLTLAFSLATPQMRGDAWADAVGRAPAEPGRDPYRDPQARFAFQTDTFAASRAALVDAHQLLWFNRANMLHDVTWGWGKRAEDAYARFKAPMLLINDASDIWFPPAQARAFVDAVNAAGGRARLLELDTKAGHFFCFSEPHAFAGALADFLRGD